MADNLSTVQQNNEKPRESEKINSEQIIKPLSELTKPTGFDPRYELIKARIDPKSIETEPPVVFEFDGQPVASLGNFSVITGKAKSRKTFFTTLILAANAGCSVENIGFKIHERAVFMDTEQSRFDVQNVQRRIERLGGNLETTEFYSLRSYGPKQRMDMIEAYIIDNQDIKLIFIDGVRDLVFDINSPEEATEVIGWLMKLTADFNIHISMILHQNKRSEDLRGHLGTEAVNKAETVILIEKDREISRVKPFYTRGKGFDEFAFEVNEAGLPYVIEKYAVIIRPENAPKTIDQSEDAHRLRLERAFEIAPKPRYGELVQALKSVFEQEGEAIGENKVKEFLKQYRNDGYIRQTGKSGTHDSRYEYVPKTEPGKIPGYWFSGPGLYI